MLGRTPHTWHILGKWQLFPHISVKRFLDRGARRGVLGKGGSVLQKSGIPRACCLEQCGRGQLGWSGGRGPGEGRGVLGKCPQGMGVAGWRGVWRPAGVQGRGQSPELGCGHRAEDGQERCVRKVLQERLSPCVPALCLPLLWIIPKSLVTAFLLPHVSLGLVSKSIQILKISLKHKVHCSPFLLKISQRQVSQSERQILPGALKAPHDPASSLSL